MILRSDGVVAKAVITAVGEAAMAAEQAISAAVARAGLVRDDLDAIVATGIGRNGVPFADRAVTESRATLRA